MLRRAGRRCTAQAAACSGWTPRTAVSRDGGHTAMTPLATASNCIGPTPRRTSDQGETRTRFASRRRRTGRARGRTNSERRSHSGCVDSGARKWGAWLRIEAEGFPRHTHAATPFRLAVGSSFLARVAQTIPVCHLGIFASLSPQQGIQKLKFEQAALPARASAMLASHLFTVVFAGASPCIFFFLDFPACGVERACSPLGTTLGCLDRVFCE
mmetsp:Transcript_40199/g.106094  ORF Transcript_40199/g.106094 Transcript_40199/m.106094 type:complete len:213 (+) Transcript_40199:1135-1773(+)